MRIGIVGAENSHCAAVARTLQIAIRVNSRRVMALSFRRVVGQGGQYCHHDNCPARRGEAPCRPPPRRATIGDGPPLLGRVSAYPKTP